MPFAPLAAATALLLALGAPASAPPSPAGAPALTALRPVAADPVTLDWKILGSLDPATGRAPAALARHDGQIVRIPGFIVPLEDYEEEGAEFLLVPYFGACVHTPPPPPNQMVYVRMEGGRKQKFGWWDPVYLEGRLSITTHDSPYGAAGFTMTGIKVSPYGAR